MNRQISIYAAVLVGVHVLLPFSAHAQPFNGWVKGTIRYLEREGNFCNNSSAVGQNCTGTSFTFEDFDQYQPIREAKVFIYDQNDALVGTGSTDINGQFLIRWSQNYTATSVRYKWHADHKDDRFDVRTTTGSPIIMLGSILTPKSHTTQTNPQFFDDRYWYDTTAHNPSNVYAGAWRMWYSLSTSASLVAAWNGEQVRYGFVAGQVGICGACPGPCSCLSSGTGYIQIPTFAPLANQSAIQHEMGHTANRYMNQRRLTGDLCYPDYFDPTLGSCQEGSGDMSREALSGSWTQISGEWMNMALEEGSATFMGDRAIYAQNNPQPTTCGSINPCDPTIAANQVEKSTGNGVVSACNNNDPPGTLNPTFLRRSALMVDRYLRDVYDSSDDHTACTPGGTTCQSGTSFIDTQARSFPEVIQTIGLFQGGYGDHQNEEPFVDGSAAVDTQDGVSVSDYVFVYQNAALGPQIDTSAARTFNCVAY